MGSNANRQNDTAAGEAWEEFITDAVYPEPQAKAREDYRNYDTPARETVREFYRQNHRFQTYDFVHGKKREFLKFNRRQMGIFEALDYLNTLVDDSDPDIELSQLQHLLQTSEAIRAAGHPDWFVLTGLIHDLGKVLCLFGEPQWAVVGDTFPVGCAFNDRIVYSEFFAANPDAANDALQYSYRRLSRRLWLAQRGAIVGPRRVHVPADEGLPAGTGAVHDSLSFVLCLASGRPIRLPVRRTRSPNAALGSGVQPIRLVFKVAGAAGLERASAVLRAVD